MRSRKESIRELDEIDKHILKILQENGRISYVDLANAVGLSTTPCLERVKRLERDDFIQGYRAQLNPQRLHAGLLVYLELQLEPQITPAQVKQAVAQLDWILECHRVAGRFDYLLKARIPEPQAFSQLVNSIHQELPGIRQLQSYSVMDELKETPALPLLG